LGHSRGGLTTKLHLAVDGKGRPLAVTLTAGQRHESTQLEPLLDGIGVPRPGGQAAHGNGRRSCWPIGATAPPPVGGCSAAAASATPSRPGSTSAAAVGGHPGSTRSCTAGATWSSGV
jgi:hypothetical protein